MANSFYARQVDDDNAVTFGDRSHYKHLDEMDTMEMDAKLIPDSRQKCIAKNWKWIYAGVGLVAGCCLTVGISYLFFSLGKSKGQGNQQSNAGSLSAAQKQDELLNLPPNDTLTQDDFSYISRLMRTEAIKFKMDMKTTLEGYMQRLLTKEDSDMIKSILQNIRNESQQELQLIKEAKEDILKLLANMKNRSNEGSPEITNMKDCVDWKLQGYSYNGVYSITPAKGTTIEVYCDMELDGGGWLVFQRRINGTTDFFRGWKEYEDGFGNVEEEFWLGNVNLHILTSASPTELRVDLKDWNNVTKYAKYNSFLIEDSAAKYAIYVSGYSGNAGDSLAFHHELKFSTRDQDNDIKRKDCAGSNKGAWWYENCSHSSLNGQYYKKGQYVGKNKGVNWEKWKGDYYSLQTASMKLRRKS